MAPNHQKSSASSDSQKSGNGELRFTGTEMFRERIILSVMSGRPVRFDNVRSDQDDVGIHDHEIRFLRLIDQLTNGSKIEISYTGTSVYFKPGILQGGRMHFDCGASSPKSELNSNNGGNNGEDVGEGQRRSIGYYLEYLLLLAPFCKFPVDLTLTGVTNDNVSVTVDYLRVCTLKFLPRFGVDSAQIKIKRRGARPMGGGEVQFTCDVVRELKPIYFVDEGRVRRIRGIAYSTRVSPQVSNRLIESSRSLLNKFIPDVYLYSDAYKGEESGRSPGYGLTLVAETTNGAVLGAEMMAEGKDVVEEVGLNAARLLYKQIELGGCVDSFNQPLLLLMMVMTTQDVNKICFGKLTPKTIQLLRDIRQFFGVIFKVDELDECRISLACVGAGLVNVGKKTN